MPPETIYKTVCQYNKLPVSDRDMAGLQEIAEDCRRVRNYVYERYGGIGGLAKIYPGYTVQNEMTRSGLREKLGLPSVYFYLAVFDALGDIKSQWSRTKKRVEKNIQANENLAPEDRHYLRFVMKQSRGFDRKRNSFAGGLGGEISSRKQRSGYSQAESISSETGAQVSDQTAH